MPAIARMARSYRERIGLKRTTRPTRRAGAPAIAALQTFR